MASSIINAGTVTLATSTTVTGSGTNWAAAGVRAGDLFSHAGVIAVIASVASDTSLTLTRAWPGATGSGLAYDIVGIEAQTRTAENNSRLRELLNAIEGGLFVEADAFGTLVQRDDYDDEAAGFVFRQTDDASGDLVTWVMGSGGSADWQGPFAYRGEAGADGDGWTGGSYSAATGKVTFASDDGLGFETDDLRGEPGADGDIQSSNDSLNNAIALTQAEYDVLTPAAKTAYLIIPEEE